LNEGGNVERDEQKRDESRKPAPDRGEQKRIVEALILAAREPIGAVRLGQVVPGLNAAGAREIVAELRADYDREQRGFELVEVAGGYRVRTRPELADLVSRLDLERPARLSRASLETLAVVAYRQPVTRGEIEQVRGVDCGPVVRNLLERHLLRIAGHREVPGRPMLYGTTRRFLELFGLASLEDLPSLRDLDELVRAAAAAGAIEVESAAEAEAEAGAAADAPDDDDAEEEAEEDEDDGPSPELH
jgi:segregation and condensation protein B